MTRWFSISQATVSVSAAENPSRGQNCVCYARAGDRMILRPTLGNVVQEQCDIEHGVRRLIL
jgi:hypothetical protein